MAEESDATRVLEGHARHAVTHCFGAVQRVAVGEAPAAAEGQARALVCRVSRDGCTVDRHAFGPLAVHTTPRGECQSTRHQNDEEQNW